MKLVVVLAGCTGVFVALWVLFGIPSNCSVPPPTFWGFFLPPLCRVPVESIPPASVIYAVPLALVLVVWLKRKLSRAKDAA